MGATLESAGKEPTTLPGEGLEGSPREAWRRLLSVSQNLPWITGVFGRSCGHIFFRELTQTCSGSWGDQAGCL